jgi:hypothetical protein
MAISTEDEIRVIQFSKNIMPLAQQEESRTMGTCVLESNVVGKQYTQDQIGLWEMYTKGARHSDTPISDPRLQRKTIYMMDKENAVLLDKEDSFKMLSDPMSSYTVAARMSLARQMDITFIAALDGNTWTGENGTDVQAWDTDYQTGDQDTILTGDKIKAAKLILDNGNVPQEDRFLGITPYALNHLYNETEVTDSDYNTIKALSDGKIDTWLGFKFVKSTLFGSTVLEADSFTYAWQKDGMAMGLAGGAFTRITERDDKSFAKQLYYSLHIGAGRLEKERCVKILFANDVNTSTSSGS